MVYNIFACFAFSLSATQKDVVKEWCRFFQINVFHEYFPCRTNVLFFFQPAWCRPNTQVRIVLFSRLTDKHSQFGTFPNRIPRELPQTVSQQSCHRMTEQISLKRNDWIFHTGPWFRPLVFWYTFPNIWAFSNFGIFNHFGHLPLLPGYKLILRLLLDLRNLVVLLQYLLFLLLPFPAQ